MRVSLGIIFGPIALTLALMVLMRVGVNWLPPMDRFGLAGLSIPILRDMMVWFPWLFFVALVLIGILVAAKRGLH